MKEGCRYEYDEIVTSSFFTTISYWISALRH